MSFSDNIPGVRTRAFTQVGASGVYTSADFDYEDADCTIKLDRDSVLSPSSLDAEVVEVGITIKALVTEVGVPEKGGEFTLSGTTYTVKRLESNDGTFVKMWVTENES